MGRVFSIGMGEDGNFAVTNISQNDPAQAKSFLSSQFGRGFDESAADNALQNLDFSPSVKPSGMKV